MSLPQREWTASRPRRRSAPVDDVVVHQRRGVDELDHRGVEDGAIARVAAQARRHQQHRRPDPLAAALLDVAAHLRDERDAGLDVADELALDGLEILADGLEDLAEVGRSGRFLGSVAQRDAVELQFRPQYWFCDGGVNALSLDLAKQLDPAAASKFATSCVAERLRRPPAQRRHLLEHPRHESRLVAFAAVRDGCQVRRIGLDQQAIGRHEGRDVPTSRDDRGNVTIPAMLMWKPRSSACPRHRDVAGEAVEHAADRRPGHDCAGGRTYRPLASRVWITIGQPPHPGHGDLGAEHRLLHVPRREVVVIVESDLADGARALVPRPPSPSDRRRLARRGRRMRRRWCGCTPTATRMPGHSAPDPDRRG